MARVTTRAGSRAGPVASPSRLPTRLELDDGVLRVRDPGVIHPEKLGDERVLETFEVWEREVAFVELSVGDALVDDPRDHRPDRRLVARLERSDRRLDAVGENDQGGFSALSLRTSVAEPPLVDGRCRLRALCGREAPVRLGGTLAGTRQEVAHDR